MYTRTFSALAGLACAAGMLVLSTPVLASTVPTARIQISDIDLDTSEGKAAFEQRIRLAARDLCSPSELDLRIESRALCQAELRAEAFAKAEAAKAAKPIVTAQNQ